MSFLGGVLSNNVLKTPELTEGKGAFFKKAPHS